MIPFSLPKAVDEDSLTDPSLKCKYSSFLSVLLPSPHALICLLIAYVDCFLLTIFVTLFFSLSDVPHDNYQALWFESCKDEITGEQVHIYKGGYWETKERGSWESCPDIFWPQRWLQSALKRLIHQNRLMQCCHKGLLVPYLDGSLLPVSLCSKRSPDQSLLSGPEGEQGFPSGLPDPLFWFLFPWVLASTPLLLSHTWEDWNGNLCAAATQVRLCIRGRKWKGQCFHIYCRS